MKNKAKLIKFLFGKKCPKCGRNMSLSTIEYDECFCGHKEKKNKMDLKELIK